ncbi:MAG: T9SS type A sorting domain-containing protein [Bacteroidota bacterium]
MKWTGLLILGLAVPLASIAQETREGRNFPPYPIPESVRLKSGSTLPLKVDLSRSKYFPPVFNQYGWSCNQSSSIGYLLTYELNRLRDTEASYPENRYPPLYAWNFLNRSTTSTGVSYFESWEIIKANGCPNTVDFPVDNNVAYWMSGYDKYYRAMQNRVIRNYSLSVATPDELLVLKQYLYDHLTGAKYGGLANFQIASGGMTLFDLPESSADPRAPYITTFGTIVGHAMTIVGYNDAIRIDRNGDGRYTNNEDINGDDVVDLNDFEVGAFIVYNTWGITWGRNGMAYLPYHLFGQFGDEGGIWNRSVHIIDAVKTFQPVLTLRAELKHASRNMLRIMAGVANDPDADKPEYILEFPLFNFQGGAVPLASANHPDGHFELGLDITPLTSYMKQGSPLKFFLILDDQNTSVFEQGEVYSFGIYNFFDGKDSVVLEDLNMPIRFGERTLVSLVRTAQFKHVTVTPVPRVFADPGEYVSVQLEASGATEPYRWELVQDYDISYSEQDYPEMTGTILFNAQAGDLETKVTLPFDFTYYGTIYRNIIVTTDGQFLFDPPREDYPYVLPGSHIFSTDKSISIYGQPLDYYMSGDQIGYNPSDTAAEFFWIANAPTNDGPVPVRIACRLSQSGQIRFYYDDTDFLHNTSLNYSLGLSGGDGRAFKEADLSDRGKQVNSILFNPARVPGDTKLDASGWLFCRPMDKNAVYEIRVRARDKNNLSGTGSVFISTIDLDSADILTQNSPNPFSGETGITFIVPERSQVRLEIFDLSGQKIASLVDEELEQSEYSVVWNGYTDNGRLVSPGVYICRLIAGDRRDSFRMIRCR